MVQDCWNQFTPDIKREITEVIETVKHVQNEFSTVINRLLPFIATNGDIINDDWTVTYELLDYEFPTGKYKGKKFETVIASDETFNYCLKWTKLNVSRDQFTKLYPFFLKLCFVAQDRIRLRHTKREIEDERNRADYCEKHGINYALDYEIRHNPQLRDFGM